LRGGEDALDRPGIGALVRTWGLQGLGFSLGEGRSMVLSEAAPDSAASEGAATDDLGGETGSGEGRERRETGQGRGFGLDKRGGETSACITIGHFRDFGDSTTESSAGDRTAGAGISVGAGVVIATGAPMNRAVRKNQKLEGN